MYVLNVLVVVSADRYARVAPAPDKGSVFGILMSEMLTRRCSILQTDDDADTNDA